MKPELYVIATPIGNLEDLSARAIRILGEVDCIAAEDTRHSAKLLQHYGITTRMFSLHMHNEQERSIQLLDKLEQGESIALISDAGTPLISDPGFCLVSSVRDAGFSVVPVPGACAAIAALSVSGLSCARFSFEGFLPAKSSGRRAHLDSVKDDPRTLVFYESPHRILDSVKDLKEVLGEERVAVMARELTKTYETIKKATLADLHDWIAENAEQQRGEFVMLVAGKEAVVESALDPVSTQALEVLLSELPLKQAVRLAAVITGEKKNQLYQYALEKKDE